MLTVSIFLAEPHRYSHPFDLGRDELPSPLPKCPLLRLLLLQLIGSYRRACFEMMASMRGSIFLSCSVFVLLVTHTAWGQVYNTSANIAPPPGNSPKLVVKTAGAYVVYTCVKGAWVPGNGYANLMDKKTNQNLGHYKRTVDSQGYLGTWMLLNAAGDKAESGYDWSGVTGRALAAYKVSTDSLPDMLVEAASHIASGKASNFAYVQMYNVSGGVPKDKCMKHSYSVTVPFHAEFCFWAQDPVPMSVPGQLVAPGRFVENFFLSGVITFKFDGSQWVDSGRVATIYPMPGAPAIGQFTIEDGVECWKLYSPSGLLVYGERVSPEVVVEPNACPWTLSKVTSATGAVMSLGSFTHIQTVSTRGGVAPVMSHVQPTALGAVSPVTYSAICNFFAS
ncbi:unnamed protein product [Calypogeia fissa]